MLTNDVTFPFIKRQQLGYTRSTPLIDPILYNRHHTSPSPAFPYTLNKLRLRSTNINWDPS